MKKSLGINVLKAARQRIFWVFDNFSKIYVSFSGGKDSSAMLHLIMEEAIRRNIKIGLLFVDLEVQYKLTIDHVADLFELYADYIEPYWVALPLHLRNAVSQFQPHWICWDKQAESDWVRRPSKLAITDEDFFPFFRHGMEFEEFVPEFGYYFGNGEPTACFVGIRTDESLNRYRTIASNKKQTINGYQWTTWCGQSLFNVYPIYDWKTQDIWIYNSKLEKPYNRLYDRMHQAGLSVHQMRICQPYGDDQRKGLHLFQVIEPETWARVVARVNGANQGALYAQESGNILGNLKISKPENHSWESFAHLILESMPQKTSEHYKNKIAVFIQWWRSRGHEMEDCGPPDSHPNWKRICKALLRNDYWCKGLSFSQNKSNAYHKYCKLMKKRRKEWNII